MEGQRYHITDWSKSFRIYSDTNNISEWWAVFERNVVSIRSNFFNWLINISDVPDNKQQANELLRCMM